MSTPVRTALAVAFAAVLVPATLAAQNASHAHIGHVTSGWSDTPGGQGLLATALAEARVAASHAGFAVRDPENLASVKAHARHVLHAVDPSRVDGGGPGAGYGVTKAAQGVARHITLAARADGASAALGTHAPHIATTAENTVARAERIVDLAVRIEAATTADEVAPLVRELAELANALLAGVDADGDGRVGWQEGEGGLEVAQTHANLLLRAEGISG